MNYTLLILVAIVGIMLGGYFGGRKQGLKSSKVIGQDGLIFGQSKQKQENEGKILEEYKKFTKK